MSTFKELQDEVLAHGFAESYRPRVKTWLNQAQARIARALDIAEKFTSTTLTTTRSVDEYTPPANVILVHGIVDEQLGFSLDYILNPDVLLARNANGTFNGRPTEYSFKDQSILLSPVPDATYTLTVTYYVRPVDMNVDGDVSTLPADFHDLMVSWTLSRAYRSEDDAQMAMFYTNEYRRDLNDLGGDTQVKSEDPTQVPGTWA